MFIDKSFSKQSLEIQEYREKIKNNPEHYQKDIIDALIKFSNEMNYTDEKMAALFEVSIDTYRRWVAQRFIPKCQDYYVARYIVRDYLPHNNYDSKNNCHDCLQNFRLEMNRMIESIEENYVKRKNT